MHDRAADDSSLAPVIQALEEELLRPEARGSRERLEGLLADDFVEFGGSGRVFDKARILEVLPSEQPPAAYTVTGFRLRQMRDDLVLATYALETRREGSEPRRSLRSSVWRLEGNAWRVMFHQGTPVPDSPGGSV